MNASKVLSDCILRHVLRSEYEQVQEFIDKRIPERYIWELYAPEFTYDAVYKRVQRFIFECGLKAPASLVDDQLFEQVRHEAFQMSHELLPPIPGDEQRPITFIHYFTQLYYLLKAAVPGAYHTPYRKYYWEPQTLVGDLEKLVGQQIQDMPVHKAPNLFSVGEWFMTLAVAMNLCTVLPLQEDPPYDYEMLPEHKAAVEQFFGWFARCLDYVPEAERLNPVQAGDLNQSLRGSDANHTGHGVSETDNI